MRGRFIHVAVLGILLLCQISVCFATNIPDPNESTKYLDAVREFADNVLKYGRDTYGPKHTPLFVDGLNIHTHEPVKWISPEGERWILSNLASQQNLFRTLDGLTRITGDQKYKQAAMEAIEYAFENLRSPNGLLYWGIAVAYDARSDDICGERITHHTLKYHYPYYELMWEIDPEATDKFIESFWIENILDWSNLDMDRYGLNDRLRSVPKGWNQEYKGGPVFFEGKGRSFFNAGSDLFYAAAILSKLSGENEPLVWSKRLAHRYIETRNPKTGISAYVYSWVEPTAGQIQLGDDFKEHLVYQDTLTLFPVYPGYRKRIIEMVQQVRGWICELLLGDLLGADGKEFTRWALEELVAWGKVAYRKEDNSFIPMLTDGTSLEGYVFKKGGSAYGPKGTVISAWPLGPIEFWAYSLAYRMSGDEYTWEMARNIALGSNFGDIGATAKDAPQLYVHTSCSDPYALLGFLELYRKTGDSTFLEISKRIGDNMLSAKFYRGFFVPSKEHIYTRFDVPVHLALLHLHAAMKPQLAEVPRVWPSCPFFNSPYRNRPLEHDIYSIYTLTKSPDLPISLHEAATLGDINQVTLLVSQGTDIDAWDFDNKAPLHYAAMNGHKQVVELLLAKGADLNTESSAGSTALCYAAGEGQLNVVRFLIAKNADINAGRVTALHYATEGGYKEIAELLITNGADINAKNKIGQTPLDVAVSRDRCEVVKLLIAKGADVYSIHSAAYLGDVAKVMDFIEQGSAVNMKDRGEATPLHYAARAGSKEVSELLLTRGANVKAENKNGATPLHWGSAKGHKDLVEFLITKGAEINARDGKWGETALHWSANSGKKTVVELLIAKGADIHTKDKTGHTPLHWAVDKGHRDVAELLIAKGADVNAKNNEGQTPVDVATSRRRKEIVELLIAKGADVSSVHLAAYIGDLAKVKAFIQEGIDINTKMRQWTPLHYAAREGHTEIVELLKKHGTKEAQQISPLAPSTRPRAQPIADMIFTGEAVGDGFGDYVNAGKDVDGDGHNDILVGAPFRDSLRGRSYLFYGGPNIDSKSDKTFDGEKVDDGFGVGVVLGDINNDDYNDVIIGAVLYNASRGRVYVFYGGIDMDTKADKIFEGQDPNSWFGRWQSFDDINGDKCPDLIVSALHWDSERGRVYVFHGSPEGAMDTIDDMIFNGENRGDAFGRQTAAGKDVNGDGHPDLLVGAEYWPENSKSRRGRAYLYHGGPDMDSEPDMIFTGELSKPGGRFGNAVELCDVDNDGFADVIIGDPFFDHCRGRTYLFFGGAGMDNVADKIFSMGDDIACGDMNKDSYKDIALGNAIYWEKTGVAHVYYGGLGKSIDQVPDKVFKGEMPMSRFGVNVNLADLNSDGFDDLVAGAWGYNAHQGRGRGQGRVYLYFGGPDK